MWEFTTKQEPMCLCEVIIFLFHFLSDDVVYKITMIIVQNNLTFFVRFRQGDPGDVDSGGNREPGEIKIHCSRR